MKAPKCRLCGELHWGGCANQVAAQPASTNKPARKAMAVKAVTSTAPVGDGVVLNTAPHPRPPKGSRKPPKDISKASLVTVDVDEEKLKASLSKTGLRIKGKPKKGKTKKAKPEVPALPAQRRPRGRPLQTEEKSSYENTKPWKKLKISRRTFYRRLKAGVMP